MHRGDQTRTRSKELNELPHLVFYYYTKGVSEEKNNKVTPGSGKTRDQTSRAVGLELGNARLRSGLIEAIKIDDVTKRHRRVRRARKAHVGPSVGRSRHGSRGESLELLSRLISARRDAREIALELLARVEKQQHDAYTATRAGDRETPEDASERTARNYE